VKNLNCSHQTPNQNDLDTGRYIIEITMWIVTTKRVEPPAMRWIAFSRVRTGKSGSPLNGLPVISATNGTIKHARSCSQLMYHAWLSWQMKTWAGSAVTAEIKKKRPTWRESSNTYEPNDNRADQEHRGDRAAIAEQICKSNETEQKKSAVVKQNLKHIDQNKKLLQMQKHWWKRVTN